MTSEEWTKALEKWYVPEHIIWSVLDDLRKAEIPAPETETPNQLDDYC